MNPAPVFPCYSAFCLVDEKFKLRTLFWIQGLRHWVRFVSTNYETFAPKKFLFTYLLFLRWGENGHLCWLLEERWKACSMCGDAEENRSDKKQVYCAIKRNKNSARTFRLPRPARAFLISSLLQSVSANERGEMTN